MGGEIKFTIRKLWGMSALIIALAVLTPNAIQAAVIHQSATLGPTGLHTGSTIALHQWLGSRFTLTETTDITAIGGHIFQSSGSIFGAVIPLAGALPVRRQGFWA